MSIEAMKLALEALDEYKYAEARTALRQAIEQAQKQEPVGEVEQIEIDDDGQASAWFKLHDHVELGDLLYTTPPQRSWVGLALEEIWDSTYGLTRIQKDDWVATDADLIEFAHIIEAKLKEKNT